MTIELKVVNWLEEIRKENEEEQASGTFERDDNYLEKINNTWTAIRQFIADDSDLVQKYTEAHASFFPIKKDLEIKKLAKYWAELDKQEGIIWESWDESNMECLDEHFTMNDLWDKYRDTDEQYEALDMFREEYMKALKKLQEKEYRKEGE